MDFKLRRMNKQREMWPPTSSAGDRSVFCSISPMLVHSAQGTCELFALEFSDRAYWNPPCRLLVVLSSTPVWVYSAKGPPVEEHKLAVWVYSAKGLRNVDLFGGKSDPYCVCKLGRSKRKIFQTKVIDNDPDPEWNHGPEEVALFSEGELHFEVYDKDFMRTGDHLGSVTVSREQCLHGLYTELDLGESNGTLTLKIAPLVRRVVTDPDGKDRVFMDITPVHWTAPHAKTILQVWIYRAGHLPDGNDAFGSDPDPYVTCTLSPEKHFRTKVIANCKEPIWDHGPEEFVLGAEEELKFEVRDKDMIGSDFLGKASLTRGQCLAGFDGRLDLGIRGGGGSLLVKVAPKTPQAEAPPLHLDVSVVSASDLRNVDLFGGKSDPYCVCKVKGKPIFKTKVISNDPDPTWNHGPVHVTLRSRVDVRFEVFDQGMLGRDTILGHATVTHDTCATGMDGEVDLGKGNGRLRLRIRRVAEGVLSASSSLAVPTGGAVSSTAPAAAPAAQASLQADEHKFHVWVHSAKDLRNMDGMFQGKSDPYCVCKLAGAGQEYKQVFKTKTIDNDLNPRWNHGPEEVRLSGFEQMVFEVFDKDLVGSERLGEARLFCQRFQEGLEEELDLGQGNGTLHVKILPIR